jgi:hypothetical protein
MQGAPIDRRAIPLQALSAVADEHSHEDGSPVQADSWDVASDGCFDPTLSVT